MELMFEPKYQALIGIGKLVPSMFAELDEDRTYHIYV